MLWIFIIGIFVWVEIFYGGHRQPRRIPIIVAAFNIQQGEKLQSVHLKTKQIDQRAFIDAMMTSGEENAYLGYLAERDIPAGRPILKNWLKLAIPKSQQPEAPATEAASKESPCPDQVAQSASAHEGQ